MERSTSPIQAIATIQNQNSPDAISSALNKIMAFNRIRLPYSYPLDKFVYMIHLDKITHGDLCVFKGEFLQAKAEYIRITGISPSPALQLNALRYAALSGKPNALRACATIFQVNVARIALNDLFTILHYAALGGNPRVINQAINWIHAYHRDRNRFIAIAGLLPSRFGAFFLSCIAVLLAIFLMMTAIESQNIYQILFMSVIAAVLVCSALTANIVYSQTLIELFCKFPGFNAQSCQVLDASASIALIAAILSDNPQAIDAISLRMLRSSSISYPTEEVTIRGCCGTTYRTIPIEHFFPRYAEYLEGKTDATQEYATKVIEYHHYLCLRGQRPRAPQQSQNTSRFPNELRFFSNPLPRPAPSNTDDHQIVEVRR